LSEYKIYADIRDDDTLRNGYFQLIEKVFPGIDFVSWYNQGFWVDDYQPHCLAVEGRIISNVSAAGMRIIVDGKILSAVQIGAVATLPEYRNQGYARILMDHVINKYENSTDLLFLFANDTVIDFYPKFGFERKSEVIFRAESDLPVSNFNARKLNVQDSRDLDLIKRIVTRRMILTELFGAVDYAYVTFWHILNVFPNNLYYLEDDKTIVILSEKNQHAYIWDIINTLPIDPKSVISRVIKSDNLKSIDYYFSPDIIGYSFDSTIPEQESPLFVRGEFQSSTRSFKFPVTAQT
jgi:ribosomal protein S18 acetylase RimI-like enzyme